MKHTHGRPQQGRALVLVVIGALLAAPAAAGVLERLFAPKAELWERWSAHDAANGQTIDHSAWDSFLRSYVVNDASGIARVSYSRVTDSDRERLRDYIEGLTVAPVSQLNRDEQLAYWINLYNALTVMTVLQHYPVGSIRDIDISPGLFADGPWRKKLVEIESEPVSLDDIEHRILRPIWREPRIHYAVNCASVGCPNLQSQAFTADNTGVLLDSAARAYVNHSRGVRFEDDKLVVSSIYVWFEPDFDRDGGVIAHLRRYAAPGLESRLAKHSGIDNDAYDWNLNDADTR